MRNSHGRWVAWRTATKPPIENPATARPSRARTVLRFWSTHGISSSRWNRSHCWAPADWLTQLVPHPAQPASAATVMIGYPLVTASMLASLCHAPGACARPW